MTETSLFILLASAISIGFIHTLIGPDHYLPFIVISKARDWSTSRTLFVTIACGIGHVLSSVTIGAVGIGLGLTAGRLEGIESIRGDIASYALIAFGIAYGTWGIWSGRRGHAHDHMHGSKHLDYSSRRSITLWTLFIIFVLGPCEPLIPLLMFPAAAYDWYGLISVTIVFGVTTIIAMTAAVYAGIRGLWSLKFGRLERYIHALAGGVIAASGAAINIFGL